MRKKLSRIFLTRGPAILVALALVAVVGISLLSAAPPGAIYTMVSQWEFNGSAGGSGCTAGWNWNDADDDTYRYCTGSSIQIRQPDFITDRGQGILWRNNAFPQTGNVAVEARVRYPAENWKGYGTDAFVMLDDNVTNWQYLRTCFNGSHSQGGAYCRYAPPNNRFATHASDGWFEVVPGDPSSAVRRPLVVAMQRSNGTWQRYLRSGSRYGDWLIIRWEYDEGADLWEQFVYLTNDESDDPTQPYDDMAATDYRTMTYDARPRAFRIGHHIYFTGSGGSWGPGRWTWPEVDYIRVWAWDLPTETPTWMPTDTSTPTNTLTPTPTVPTNTPTPTPTHTPTSTPTETPTDTPTSTPTDTPTPTSTDTPASTPTDTPVPTETWTPSPTATPTDTATPTETPTATATETSTPTSTPTDTPTPTPTNAPPPITDVELTARYPTLVLMGPDLGLDAQTLYVHVTGGTAPYNVMLYVTSPSGDTTAYPFTGSSDDMTFDPGSFGDTYFGVREEGVWSAQAVVDAVPSNVVTWEVRWYPIHVIR